MDTVLQMDHKRGTTPWDQTRVPKLIGAKLPGPQILGPKLLGHNSFHQHPRHLVVSRDGFINKLLRPRTKIRISKEFGPREFGPNDFGPKEMIPIKAVNAKTPTKLHHNSCLQVLTAILDPPFLIFRNDNSHSKVPTYKFT